ncbi:MAG TPA: hypothetical protein PK323_11715 [Bacteroidia bacterium]|nr:hypothetical protein [Bacteroidia bacterium]
MKKIISLLTIFFSIVKLNAAVLLVNNLAGGPGQYAQINAAITAANPGDTIYVSGSNIVYAAFNITKDSITIIGPGTYSDKQNAFPANINGFTCDNNLSHIKIKGLLLSDDANFAGTANISHLELIGNAFSTTAGYINFNGASNFSFINIANNIFTLSNNDIIDFVNSSGFSNVIIQNNILFGSIRSLNAPNSVVNNNIFINILNAFDDFGASFFSNVMIKDNIFYKSHPTNNTSGCTFQNNISYSPTITYPLMGGTGNIDNTDPLFINAPTGGYTTAFNFHLLAGSPAIGASSIGDDIGYYGGSFLKTETGETLNMPVIRLMDVQNQNVPQNGNVNVKVKSTKSRTN